MESSGSGEASSEASLTAKETADSYINWPEDTPMGDGTVNPQDLSLTGAPSAIMPSVRDPPGHPMFNPFNISPVTHEVLNDAQVSQEVPGDVSGRSERRSTTNHPMREVTTEQPSRHRESTRDSRAANQTSSRRPRRSEDLPERLTSTEVTLIRLLLNDVERFSRRHKFYRKRIEYLNDWCDSLQDQLREAQGKIEVIDLANRSFTHHTGPERSSHESCQHHPYAECERPAPRAMCAPRQDEPVRAVTVQGATRQTTQNLAIENAPAVTEDVVMEPMGISTRGTQSIVPKSPVTLATAPYLGPSVGSSPARAVRPEKRAPIPMANYRWVDRVTGIRHSLVISQAGLPMFLGPIATAFQKLQGSSPSPADLTRRIWLFYRGRNRLDIWKDAVSAARDIRRKVILPQSLQLLLELADLPRNEWEKITDLWSTSSEPLSSISPGIRPNPNGFAGLDKHDIETADFIGMWTSGSLKRISAACGQRKERPDVKSAFQIALTSPNLWHTNPGVLRIWHLTPNLKRLRYEGILEPEPIALWLRKEVGLASYDIQARFAPFSRRAFDTDAQTNPRVHFTMYTLPKTYPTPIDDSLPEFGDDLEWTPAHGPQGPPLKPKSSAAPGEPSTSAGAADAHDTPMRG